MISTYHPEMDGTHGKLTFEDGTGQQLPRRSARGKMVQLREKESSTREFIERAIRLKEVLTPYGVPLIINDRVDVALAANADGVHVGQSDMPYEMVKRLLPEGKIIGLSVESPEQVL